MIAVAATTLSRLAERCTTWAQPKGMSEDAWARIKACRWHGNIRALVRVLESAFVDYGVRGGDTLLQLDETRAGIKLWEPADRKSAVAGKRVSGRVDLGGSRITKKQSIERATIK